MGKLKFKRNINNLINSRDEKNEVEIRKNFGFQTK